MKAAGPHGKNGSKVMHTERILLVSKRLKVQNMVKNSAHQVHKETTFGVL